MSSEVAKKFSENLSSKKTSGSNLANVFDKKNKEKEESQKGSSPNIFEKVVDTGIDFWDNVIIGAINSVEGVIDFAAGLTGNFGTDGWKLKVKDFVKKDLFDEDYMTRNMNVSGTFYGSDRKASIIKENQLVKGVAQGAGQLIPTIAIGPILKGIGVSAKAIQSVNIIYIGTSAGGNSMEQALNEGASIGEATKYGILSGATEMATEKIFSGLDFLGKGIVNKGIGKGVISKLGKSASASTLYKISKSATGKLVTEMIGEGTEEVLSDLADPLWKSLTYEKGTSYSAPEFKDLFNSFMVGALTSGVVQGTTSYGGAIRNGFTEQQALNILEDINNINQEELALKMNDSLTPEKIEEFRQRRAELAKMITEVMAKEKNVERATKFVENYGELMQNNFNFNANQEAVISSVESLNNKYETNIKLAFSTQEEIVSYLNEAQKSGKSVKQLGELDGFIDGDKIVINKDSKVPYNEILGHELTHFVEDDSTIDELTTEYIKELKEDGKYEEVSKQYEGYDNVDKEIVADYIGKKLFSSYKEIKKLSTKNRSLSKKLLSFIDGRIKSSSDERSQLSGIRDKFNHALEETAKAEKIETKEIKFRKTQKAKEENKEVKKVASETDSKVVNEQRFKPKKTDSITSINSFANLYDSTNISKKSVSTAINEAISIIKKDYISNTFDYNINSKVISDYFYKLNVEKSSNRSAIITDIVNELGNTQIVYLRQNIGTLADTLGDEWESFSKQINNALNESINAYSKQSYVAKVSKAFGILNNRVKELQKGLSNERKLNHVVNRVLDLTRKLNDETKNVYSNTSIHEELKPFAKMLSSITSRDYISKDVFPIIKEYRKLLENEKFSYYVNEEIFGYIDSFLASENDNNTDVRRLNYEQALCLKTILSNSLSIINTYDDMVLNDERVSVSETASDGYKDIKKSSKFSTSIPAKFLRSIVDPRTLFERLGNYDENSIFKKLFDDLKAKNDVTLKMRMNYETPFNVWRKNNKKLSSKLHKAYDDNLTIGEALSVLEISRREKGYEHLINGGITVEKQNGDRKVLKITDEYIKNIDSTLGNEYKSYLELSRSYFENCYDDYKEVSIKKYGFAYEKEKNYFPIKSDRHEFGYKAGDNTYNIAFAENYYRPSFTKKTITKANNAISITSIDYTISKHIKQLSIYCGISQGIYNFNKVMNYKIEDNNGKTTLDKYIADNVYSGWDKYTNNLFNALLGYRANQSEFNKILSKIRGKSAVYALGFNFKVAMEQLSSFPMAFSELSLSSMSKAVIGKSNMDELIKRSPSIKFRYYEGGVIQGATLLDNIGEVGNKTMAIIGVMDKFATSRIWLASQHEVAKKHKGDPKYAVGTELNMEEAVPLCEDVVNKTQQQYDPLENGSITTTSSEIVKSLLMYTSSTRKYFTRLYTSLDKYRIAREMLKKNTDISKVDSLKQNVSQSKKYVTKTFSAYTVSVSVAVLIGMAFRYALGREDKDKNVAENLLSDFFQTGVVSLLPIVKDISGFLTDGYEINVSSLESFQNLLESTKSLFDMILDSNKTDKEVTSTLYKCLNSSCLLLGIPSKNITDYVNGLIKMFSPKTAIECNSVLYNTGDSTINRNLKYYASRKKDDIAKAYMNLKLEKKGIPSNDNLTDIAYKLYLEGITLSIKSIPSSIQIDGEAVPLSGKQKDTFSKYYNNVSSYYPEIVKKLNSKQISSEQAKYIIERLFSWQYELAVKNINNDFELSKQASYLDKVDMFDLAYALSYSKSYSGSSKKTDVFSFINKLKLSKDKKKLIYSACGY